MTGLQPPLSLRGRRVLVTGACGFTGNALVRGLLASGASVRAFVRCVDRFAPDLRGRVDVSQGDIRDPHAVLRAVDGCEIVYHLAAWYRDASASRRDYWEVNVTGTEHVLAACEAHRVKRLIHCSTGGVHGDVQRIPADEATPFNPGDEYQCSKLEAEQRVWAWFRRTGLPTVVVRPAGIIGPGEPRFLKLFRSIRHGYFVMLGSGATLFHSVDVEDLVRGFVLCASRPEAVGEAFCICGDRYVTLNEFVALIADILGVPRPRWGMPVWPVYAAGAVCEAVCVPLRVNPPLHRRRVGFFTHNRAFTSAKAKRLLGYLPQVRFEESLRRTAAWYVAHGHLRPTNGVIRGAHV